MEKYDSLWVQQSMISSPLCETPSLSNDILCTLYSTLLPPFVLDVLEKVGPNSDEIVELPEHSLQDFSFRLIGGFPDPTLAEF